MCGVSAVRANGSAGGVWRGVGVRTVHVVHVVMTPANVGSAGLVTPSVRELMALLLAVCKY